MYSFGKPPELFFKVEPELHSCVSPRNRRKSNKWDTAGKAVSSWSERNLTTSEVCSIQTLSVSHVTTDWTGANMRRLGTRSLLFPRANGDERLSDIRPASSGVTEHSTNTIPTMNWSHQCVSILSTWRTPKLTQIRPHDPPRCWAWRVLFLCATELHRRINLPQKVVPLPKKSTQCSLVWDIC